MSEAPTRDVSMISAKLTAELLPIKECGGNEADKAQHSNLPMTVCASVDGHKNWQFRDVREQQAVLSRFALVFNKRLESLVASKAGMKLNRKLVAEKPSILTGAAHDQEGKQDSYGSENLLVGGAMGEFSRSEVRFSLISPPSRSPVARTPVPEASRLTVGADLQGIAALHKHHKLLASSGRVQICSQATTMKTPASGNPAEKWPTLSGFGAVRSHGDEGGGAHHCDFNLDEPKQENDPEKCGQVLEHEISLHAAQKIRQTVYARTRQKNRMSEKGRSVPGMKFRSLASLSPRSRMAKHQRLLRSPRLVFHSRCTGVIGIDLVEFHRLVALMHKA
ncbi:hypothetical protein KC333_g73 [Hortaea werneckii]|nr:hypothetical protein KC333_g73 [Hortaea werneckii]